jgi:hypothetical protein
VTNQSKEVLFFSVYRQKDSNLSFLFVGYLQKSVVILSERSDVLLWPLFRHAVSLIGPEYFAVGDDASSFLESVFTEVKSWAMPIPGLTHELPLLGNFFFFFFSLSFWGEAYAILSVLGNVLKYYVACDEFKGLGYDGTVSNLFFSQDLLGNSLSPIDELSVYENLYILLPELWTLWELLLTGER